MWRVKKGSGKGVFGVTKLFSPSARTFCLALIQRMHSYTRDKPRAIPNITHPYRKALRNIGEPLSSKPPEFSSSACLSALELEVYRERERERERLHFIQQEGRHQPPVLIYVHYKVDLWTQSVFSLVCLFVQCHCKVGFFTSVLSILRIFVCLCQLAVDWKVFAILVLFNTVFWHIWWNYVQARITNSDYS